MKKKKIIIIGIVSAILAILLGAFLYFNNKEEITDISYNDFIQMVENKKVESIKIYSESMEIIDINDNKYKTTYPDYEMFKKEMLEHDIEILRGRTIGSYLYAIPIIIIIILYITIFVDIKNNRSSSIQYKVNDFENLSFDDIGGLHDIKKDIKLFINIIKNPDKYKKLGIDNPKGLLFVGEPGTGKTLMAKVIAKEVNSDFYYLNASDLNEIYVGKGAKRVRKLFKEARKSKNKPAIIFIDEIDSIGNRDQLHTDNQTINALLTEIDGFKKSDDIIIIGATNRLDLLDEALTRSGRLCHIYTFENPKTYTETKEILEIYLKGLPLDKSLNILDFAMKCFKNKLSGADISTLINDSKIIMINNNLTIMNDNVLFESLDNLMKNKKFRSKKNIFDKILKRT